MPIYQHETMEPVYGKVQEYLDGIFKICVPEVCEPQKLKMVGVFQTDGSTGQMPEVIAIWELADWKTFAWKEKTRSDRKGLKNWMTNASQWRQKGFDRQLIPVSFSPRPPVYPKSKSRGAVVIQQTMLVQPGKVPAYLERVQKTLIPQAKKAGMELEAFWLSAFRPLELVALWSMKDWDSFAARQEKLFKDPDKAAGPAWTQSMWAYLSDFQEKVLLPAPYSPLGGGGPDFTITG